jgi:hypothetical protein
MIGKAYFDDGHVEQIVNCEIHSNYDVEFWTEDAHYNYIGLIEDIPDVYFPNSKELCKHINHRFYKLGPFMMTDIGQLERNASIVDIDHIDIFFGKENNYATSKD